MPNLISRSAAASREGYLELESHAGRDHGMSGTRVVPATPASIIAFWREVGPSRWFAKDAALDRRFREAFIDAYETAGRGDFDDWERTPEGALALLILLDQFPRNAFRGTPRMYESDAKARRIAADAIAAGHDRNVEEELRTFLYMPLAHSEMLKDQDRSVLLFRQLGERELAHAEHHRDIVRRFGRFPHRNAILGRAMTDEERQFLDRGGFTG